VITLDELVLVAHLTPSVGPFTLRRLFLRVRVFANGTYRTEEVRTALPEIRRELLEILPPADYVAAVQGIDALLEREDRLSYLRAPDS
jgi:hypothetical protein